jgi:hypothetical protein
MIKKRVAIIGAGPSGLCAIKNAIDFGFEPCAFEKSKNFGGVWFPDQDQGVWNTMHTNLSKFSMSFLDHEWPRSTLIFPNSKDVFDYVASYVEKFELNKFIKLNTIVLSAKQNEDKSWRLRVFDFNAQETREHTFDFLIVSCGKYEKPKIPFGDHTNFNGIQFHSFDYTANREKLKDKRVIVIGHSFSAVEIAADLVNHAQTVTNLFRQPRLVIPKLVKRNIEGTELYNVFPPDFFFFSRQNAYLTDEICDEDKSRKMKVENFKRFFGTQQFDGKTCPPDLLLDYSDKELPKISISNEYFDYVRTDLIKTVRSNVKSIESNGIELINGQFYEADAIVYCTGFNLSDNMNFFDMELKKKLGVGEAACSNVFMNCVNFDVENMALIGFFFVYSFMVCELQIRWIYSLFSNKIEPPTQSLLEANKNKHYHVHMFDFIGENLSIKAQFDEMTRKNSFLRELLWNIPISISNFSLSDEKSLRHLVELCNFAQKLYTKEQTDQITERNFI